MKKKKIEKQLTKLRNEILRLFEEFWTESQHFGLTEQMCSFNYFGETVGDSSLYDLQIKLTFGDDIHEYLNGELNKFFERKTKEILEAGEVKVI